MRWIKYLIVFVLFLLISCSRKTIQDTQTFTVIDSVSSLMEHGTENLLRKTYFNGKNESENYIPNPDEPLLHKQKIIKTVCHFMYDSLGQNNLPREKATNFAIYVVGDANKKLGENPQMKLPVGNQTPSLDVGYRFKIVPGTDDPEDNGIYFHNDQELYFYLDRGKDKNNYDRSVIEKYKIGGDSLLNVFFMPAHPDSIASRTYSAKRVGIALGNAAKISGMYANQDRGYWDFSPIFNHEVGHILGLRHTWSGNDGCDDTPKHPNCWSDSQCKGGTASNNMMDYNSSQRSVTPCQIGRMNLRLTNITGRQRKFLEETWCDLDDSADIIINGEKHWKGEKDLSNNIFIENNATLIISSRLSMAKGGQIFIEPGGKLILDNARLHNSCGDEWLGIIKADSQDNPATIEYLGEIKIENTQGAIDNLSKGINKEKFR